MKKLPRLKAVIIALTKVLLISLLTDIILLCAYFIAFKVVPGEADVSVIKIIGFGSGFIYYFWFEQGRLFPKSGVRK
ncbi:hypothetical protein DWU98_05425 [Dyella monticola]|uniref:Uncharacterized protein n=1 Tax=Dyella monticola TaxID=1927958 RepID=A0A370X661_9GAMM|nr:hypothetical protein [Dyella monticola]RDS83757.1 hypothetical protein DWU98_05425 [Dyella monticola]